MHSVRPSRFLQVALLADAAVSGATGVLHLSAAASLSALLDLPHVLLIGTGEFFVVYALLLVMLATRARLWSAPVVVVVLGNALWALASVGLLLSGALSPNAWGIAFVLMQAVAVLLFAALEWRGLRNSPSAAPSARAVMS
jgi:hypothetical protein